MQTMTVRCPANAPAPAHITIVDDVVTKGATLLAAASLIKDRFPDSEVKAFAVVRTMGFIDDIERIKRPCTGTITLEGGEAMREP